MTDTLQKKSQHFERLHSKWSEKHKQAKHTVARKHAKSLQWAIDTIPAKRHIAATVLSAVLLLAPGSVLQGNITKQPLQAGELIQTTKKINPRSVTVLETAGVLPHEMRPLTSDEEKDLSTVLSKEFKMDVKPEINGMRLNRSYGLIGAEQHLKRYPGDTVQNHVATTDERKMFLASGVAPGLGAWGYFADSKNTMTQKDIDREKYYIAVQTFLAPGFNDHVAEYRDFFKYRKMLVVNPKTGAAVVCDIADAGPGPSTGKHLGGSPEVMHLLDLGTGPRKGAVVYFFIDDPDDTIPLGPVQ